MSLDHWLQIGWLQRNETTIAEVAQLRQVIDRDIADASIEELSDDGRFSHAYDAALQLCILALRAEGFKVKKGQGHHKKGIESLPFVLGKDFGEVTDHIERCSRLRGQAIYDRIGVVQRKDAEDLEDLLEVVKELKRHVDQWLVNNHAELLPEK